MRPSLIFEILRDEVGFPEDRIWESGSLDERPETLNGPDGYFVTVAFEEYDFRRGMNRGPRTMTVAIHYPYDGTRDYGFIEVLHSTIQQAFLAVENRTGEDGSRVSQIAVAGRGPNAFDEGWNTVTQTATYGVLVTSPTT